MVKVKQQKQFNKRLLVGSMTMIVFFLTGCTGWTGLIPEQYDGKQIERDEEAIESFEDRQEIVGKSKELYLDEPYSSNIHQPALSFEGTIETLLEEKMYVIGEDLPESRYLFAIVEPGRNSGHIRLEDAEGNRIADEYLDVQSGIITVELDLHEGNILHVSGGEKLGVYASASGELADELPISGWIEEMNRVASEDSITLQPGIWEVGAQLSAGEYQLVDQPRTGFIYIFSNNETEPRIIELQGTYTMGENNPEFVEIVPVTSLTLKEGDKLYLHNAPSISIEKK